MPRKFSDDIEDKPRSSFKHARDSCSCEPVHEPTDPELGLLHCPECGAWGK